MFNILKYSSFLIQLNMIESKAFGIYNLSILWLILISISGSHCGINEKLLLRYLFDQNRADAHNILERPSKNDSQPVEVRIKAYLTQLIDVDEKNQIIHTNIWLDLKWRDYHFLWNPVQYGGVYGFNVPADKVWRPDLLLFNSADDKFDGTYPVNVVVRNTSLMQWVPPGMFKSTCDIDITWFPFDVQSCTLKFGSWTYSGKYIDLRLQCPDDDNNEKTGVCTESSMLNLESYVMNGEFNIVDCPINRLQYSYNNETYMNILMTIRMQRKPLYYIFNLIIPCVLISTMALLEFTLPPDAGEKISLGVTILLSMTMFLLLVADKLPQTSGAIPLIGIYFACIMIMCSLSIVFTVLVLNYHHRSVNLKPVPPLIKKVVNTWLARILFMKQHKEFQKDNISVHQNNIDNQMIENSLSINFEKCKNQTDSNSKMIFSNIFDVETDFRVHGIGKSKVTYRIPKAPSYMNFLAAENSVPLKTNKPSWSSCSSRHELTVIINELKKITQKIKDDEEEVTMAKEWKFAARVIDRCCLIVFSLFTIISTLTVLTRAPKSEKSLA